MARNEKLVNRDQQSGVEVSKSSQSRRRIETVGIALAAVLALQTLGSIFCEEHSKLFAITDEVRSMCQQAEQLINSGKFNDAVNLLHRAGSIDPSCAEVHGYLGMAYQNSQKTSQAIGEYTKALQLNPQMSFINVNLGTCLMNMNQLDQAATYFQRYLQENPNAADAAQVQQYLQQCGARKGQNNLRGLVEQGQSLLNQRKFPQAINAFEQAISQQPNFAAAHFFLGYALAQSGQSSRAISEFQAALQIDPSMKEAVMNIASNYQTLGDCANAIAWYERYLKENPGSPKAADVRQRISGLKQQLSQQARQGGGGFAQSGSNGFAQQGSVDDYLVSAASGGKYFRWTRMPIRVCIASGAGVFGYRDSFRQTLMDAFSMWAQGSENRLSFTLVNDPSNADVYCDWTADTNQIVAPGRAVEGGITKLNGQPMANGSDVGITNARMTLLTNRSGNPLSDDDMKKVCLHEVGHALGINGHSNNNSDVMFFSEAPTVWPALTKRDKTTICRLYANYPPGTGN